MGKNGEFTAYDMVCLLDTLLKQLPADCGARDAIMGTSWDGDNKTCEIIVDLRDGTEIVISSEKLAHRPKEA